MPYSPYSPYSPRAARRLAALPALTSCLTLALTLANTTAIAQPAPPATVTTFGTLDLNVTVSRASGQRSTGMDQGGNLLPSRLGFRGTEDLGGGLQASFWLESALLPQSGASQGAFWGRRSTLSLSSSRFGELRLGRDYTPSFWNVSSFAPFGTVGVAGSSNLMAGWPFGLGGARTLARASESVGYFLPKDLGGLYGQAMVAMRDVQDGNRYRGARLGWAQGRWDVAGAYGRTDARGETTTVATVGASLNLDVVRLMGHVYDQRAPGISQRTWLLGAGVPMGPHLLRASVSQAKQAGTGEGSGATQLGLGYTYQLSRRSALYATWAHINNRGDAEFSTSDLSPPVTPGGTSAGLQVGVSHNF